jgi:hypothetical protein
MMLRSGTRASRHFFGRANENFPAENFMRAVADTDCVSSAGQHDQRRGTPVISKPAVKETTTTCVARAAGAPG